MKDPMAGYRKRLAAAQRRGIEITLIGGMCPFQVMGRYTAADRPFYLRARHGEWWLYVGEAGWPTDYLEWPEWFDHVPVAQGEDPTMGGMADKTGIGILVANIPEGGV